MQDYPFTHYNRRWYDNLQNMTLAVHISRELPTEIQALIARSLNEAIDSHRKHRRTDKYAISLGHNRVLGLYKASYCRRWHDPDPVTYRAFNFMATIPDAYLVEMANRILRVGNHVTQQKQSSSRLSDRGLLTGEVQGILRDGAVEIRQSDQGIRLAGERPTVGKRDGKIEVPIQIRHQAR
jgi:hypothetical protein